MAGRRLSMEERVVIEVGIARGDTDEEIGVRLGRHRSTIWREITAAVGADRDRYQATRGQARAERQAQRPKALKLAAYPDLAERVAAKLKIRWSPHAIAAWLQRIGATVRVCAETIYRAVYTNQASSGLAAGSWKFLVSGRRRRRPRPRTEQTRRNQLGPIRSVHARGKSAAERTEAGHWEGDLIMGAGNRSAVVTLVERVSRYTLLGDLPDGHTAQGTLACVLELFDRVPPQLRRSLTWDQGREMTHWQLLEDSIEMPVYFCDPHAPWQRPSNEANNRLLRRWLPKGTDLTGFPQPRLDEIAHHLNTMPRRLHQWDSAHNRYHALSRDHQ